MIQEAEDITSYSLVRAGKALIPYAFAKEKKLLALEDGEKVVVAISDLYDVEAIDELRLLLKKPIQLLLAKVEAIDVGLERCYAQKPVLTDIEEKPKFETEEGYDLLEKNDENPTLRIVNTVLLEAIGQGASDIHFEPMENGIHVRYRIDGCLQKRHLFQREYQEPISARIKVMSKLDVAEHRLPQDGRIKLRHGGREIDFRVSTLPTVHGERIVLRILDRGNVVLGLDRIGMDAGTLEEFRKLIDMPEGIVLVTGPTGSGKTTTLYSAISEMNRDETNVITVEDPVEYKLTGISQMHVNPRIELGFATALRHILRQDPDVIMIGEIRDRETAEIAIQASLTGHLVFSTLHTNDAPSALTRLADMGIEPYLLASSILGVVAQRLVRKLCGSCRGDGCGACFETGYKGRVAIYELMTIGPKIKAQVLKSQDAEKLRNTARSEGMRTLFEQGLELVDRGVTSREELLRVTKVEGYEPISL